MAASLVGKGYYQKKSKKKAKEDFIFNEFVDKIHSVIDLVFFVYIV
jgi:stalled ribosome alternative rescue factor ArfA